MKKLAGTDVIVLIKAAINDSAVLKEAQTLQASDFNADDLIVNYFFNAYPNGFSSNEFSNSDKTAVATTLDSMTRIKKEITNQGLRKAHNLLQNVRNASNEVVLLENSVNEYYPESGVETQFKAAKLVSFLSKYVDGQPNKIALSSAVSDINSGNLESASKTIHKIFSNAGMTNTRQAFVTIKNQVGEGYQMCAKGIYQSGQPIPMAMSNCREYCIDARLEPDGTVGCNYLKWLNENLITQEQACNLFDKLPAGVKDVEYMNLDKGVRTKFPMSDQDSQDMRIIREEEKTKEITMKPWEEQLEKANEKPMEKFEKPKPLASDSAIELLLQDMRDVFDEDELDTLEEEIRAITGE